MYTYQSLSPHKTWKLGQKLAGLLAGNELLALNGDLGTGKTVLARGIIEGLGSKEIISSPTFTIIHEYQQDFPIYHLDLYRIQEGEELVELGLEEYFYGEGVTILEWPSIAWYLFPEEYLEICFQWSTSTVRMLTFIPYGGRYLDLVKELKDCVGSGS